MDDSTSKDLKSQSDGSRENSEHGNFPVDSSQIHKDRPFGPLANGERTLLSGTQMTPDCLRPDDVCLIVHTPDQLSAAAREHLADCKYCQMVTAAASSDLQQHSDFVSQLASPPRAVPVAKENNIQPGNTAGRIVRYGLPAAVVILFLFLVGPDSIRSMAPIKTWSSGLLNRRFDRATEIRDENLRVAILSEKISRQPNNHLLYLLRSQAHLRLGHPDQARSDWTICCSLSGVIDDDSEFNSWSKEAVQQNIPPRSDDGKGNQ